MVGELHRLREEGTPVEIPEQEMADWNSGIAKIDNAITPIGEWVIINFQETDDQPAPPIIIIIGDVEWKFEDTDGDGEYDKVTITTGGISVTFYGDDLGSVIESLLNYLLELLGWG